MCSASLALHQQKSKTTVDRRAQRWRRLRRPAFLPHAHVPGFAGQHVRPSLRSARGVCGGADLRHAPPITWKTHRRSVPGLTS
jgi:hypothetical protein